MRHFARNIILAIVLIGAIVAVFQYTGPSGGSTKLHAGHGRGHEHDDHAHGEGKVELSDAKIAAAGIELATAGPVRLHESILLNGILQPNQEALAQVTPRFPGIIREIKKSVGDRVEKNELLARIESNQSLTVYDLRAPFAGTVIERHATLGEFASEQKSVFVIADLSTVWADFAVYRRDLGRIQPGDTVIVSTGDGLPPVEGKLAYVAPVGSAETQTALARAVLRNDERRLRPGLFVTGRVLLSARPAEIAIKTSALQTIENRTVVFVRSGDAFEARDVEIGNRDAEHAEILFGITEGEVYAAKNSFVIKAELGKASAAHEH